MPCTTSMLSTVQGTRLPLSGKDRYVEELFQYQLTDVKTEEWRGSLAERGTCSPEELSQY